MNDYHHCACLPCQPYYLVPGEDASLADPVLLSSSIIPAMFTTGLTIK